MATNRFFSYKPTKYRSQFVPTKLPLKQMQKTLAAKQKEYDTTLAAGRKMGLDFKHLPFASDPVVAEQIKQDFESDVDEAVEMARQGNVNKAQQRILELKDKKEKLMEGPAGQLQANYKKFQQEKKRLKDKLESEDQFGREEYIRELQRAKQDYIDRGGAVPSLEADETEYNPFPSVVPGKTINLQEKAKKLAAEKGEFSADQVGAKVTLKPNPATGKLEPYLAETGKKVTSNDLHEEMFEVVRSNFERDEDVQDHLRNEWRFADKSKYDGFQDFFTKRVDDAVKSAVNLKKTQDVERSLNLSGMEMPDEGSGSGSGDDKSKDNYTLLSGETTQGLDDFLGEEFESIPQARRRAEQLEKKDPAKASHIKNILNSTEEKIKNMSPQEIKNNPNIPMPPEGYNTWGDYFKEGNNKEMMDLIGTGGGEFAGVGNPISVSSADSYLKEKGMTGFLSGSGRLSEKARKAAAVYAAKGMSSGEIRRKIVNKEDQTYNLEAVNKALSEAENMQDSRESFNTALKQEISKSDLRTGRLLYPNEGVTPEFKNAIKQIDLGQAKSITKLEKAEDVTAEAIKNNPQNWKIKVSKGTGVELPDVRNEGKGAVVVELYNKEWEKGHRGSKDKPVKAKVVPGDVKDVRQGAGNTVIENLIKLTGAEDLYERTRVSTNFANKRYGKDKTKSVRDYETGATLTLKRDTEGNNFIGNYNNRQVTLKDAYAYGDQKHKDQVVNKVSELSQMDPRKVQYILPLLSKPNTDPSKLAQQVPGVDQDDVLDIDQVLRSTYTTSSEQDMTDLFGNINYAAKNTQR